MLWRQRCMITSKNQIFRKTQPFMQHIISRRYTWWFKKRGHHVRLCISLKSCGSFILFVWYRAHVRTALFRTHLPALFFVDCVQNKVAPSCERKPLIHISFREIIAKKNKQGGQFYRNRANWLRCFNPLEFRGNHSATSNNMKLVHWPLMGGPLHLVQRGGDWAGPQPAHSPPSCTKCNSSPINGQCTNHRITVHHGHAPASHGHFIPVLTAGRQSRRLRRPTDKPENSGSRVFRRRTESVEPAADWAEKNTIDICLSPRTENVSFSTVHTVPNNTI